MVGSITILKQPEQLGPDGVTMESHGVKVPACYMRMWYVEVKVSLFVLIRHVLIYSFVYFWGQGAQHGFFSFGGSTVLLLFQRGRIVLDPELVANSRQPIETLVKVYNGSGYFSLNFYFDA